MFKTFFFSVLLCSFFNTVDAQSQFRLNAVTSPGTERADFWLGDPMNIKVSFKVDSPAYTYDQAMVDLKKYYLIMNGIPYPDKTIGKMELVAQGIDSVRRETLKEVDTNGKEKIAVKSAAYFYTVAFQTRLDPAYKDTNKEKVPSAFWKQHYQPLSSHRQISVSLLSSKPESEPVQDRPINLGFYPMWRVLLFVIAFAALLSFVLWRASLDNFSLLRDDVGCTATGMKNPYSLSRVQVFLWTFIILGLAAYCWAVLDYFPQITAAHLVLMGIAAGQRIIAQMMDKAGGPNKSPGLTVPAAPAAPASVKCSVSFFTDIISDNTGLSVTRLQYVIITFIYLVMFVTTAIQKLELMDFSVEQLALMGTSAGLYLWDKKLN